MTPEGWQPIATAPRDNPNRDIEVRRGAQMWLAHWHHGLPDDYQPPVPPGWYYRAGAEYRQVWPEPTEWRPAPTAPVEGTVAENLQLLAEAMAIPRTGEWREQLADIDQGSR